MDIKAGYRFGVYGADSTGEVIDTKAGMISYRYDHNPVTTWAMNPKDFGKITFPERVTETA